jgi:alkylation response protein AidB-like acyl-CoA dehydrogenase
VSAVSTGAVESPENAAGPAPSVFTDDHQQLRESIRRFVANELRPHAGEWERDGFPDSVFTRMGELGFLGLDKPEEYGGQGGDYFSAIVLAEELPASRCSGLAMGIAVHTDMVMPPLEHFGTHEQKLEWLAPAIAGEKILCLGITEPDAGSDVAGIRTHARREAGGDWVINGSKTYITNGHRADLILLVTKTDPDAGTKDGFTLFVVPMRAPGVVVEQKLDKLGMRSSDTALIAFQDVRVPVSAVLGDVGKGFYKIMWQLQGERLINAAGWVATAQLCFEETLAFAKQRKAFGQTIGSFQAIRHKFADMAMQIEASRQLVYATAGRFAHGDYPVREISMAKLHSAQMVCRVADECLQIHGGAGYIKEYDVERVWRDMRLARIGGGSDEIMLDVIGKSYGL